MQILNVATEPIKIEINSQKGSLSLHTTLPKIDVQAEAARLEIRQPKGDLKIDSTAFRSSYGIKNFQTFCRDNGQMGKNSALTAVSRIVEDGNRMAQIASGEDAIVEIAADSCFTSAGELSWVPLEKPEVSYTPNRPQIKFIKGNFKFNVEPGNLETTYQPGKVNVSVAQYPSIKKWTSENKVDLML